MVDIPSAEKCMACARHVISAAGSAQRMQGAGSVEKSDDTLCVPSLQKCAHVLQFVRNVRNAARVRIRLANWVVCAAMRV